MPKIAKIKIKEAGNYVGPISIYYNSVNDNNLIARSVSITDLTEGVEYQDLPDDATELFFVDENTICGKEEQIFDILNQTIAETPTPSVSISPSPTPGSTVTPTPSITPTRIASVTPSITVSITPSVTPTITVTPTTSATPSATVAALGVNLDPVPTCVRDGDWNQLNTGFANYRLELINAQPGTTYNVVVNTVSTNNATVVNGASFASSFTAPSDTFFIDNYVRVNFLDTSADPNAVVQVTVTGTNGQANTNGTGVKLEIISAEEFNNIPDCETD